MTPCNNCQRVKPKRDALLEGKGLVECRPCEDSRVIVKAFWLFAEHHECGIPFHVKASGLHKEEAWPYQFHPDALEECDGYLPNDGALTA